MSSDTSCALHEKMLFVARSLLMRINHPNNECHHTNGQAKHRQTQEVNINSKVTELMDVTLQGQKGVPAQAGTRLQDSPT